MILANALEHASKVKEHVIDATSVEHRHRLAQRLTPPEVATLAASMFSDSSTPINLLDLGAGTGRLTIAAAERYTDKALRDKAAPVLKSLKIVIPTHGKASDLIVWNRDRNWLFLMEDCSSHEPIDVTRKREIANLFGDAKCPLVLVSCFPDRATMRKYLVDLAWETEAWCADTPDHMIHLDGERFLGPYDL